MERKFISFEGLNAPVQLTECAELIPVIYSVTPRWNKTIDNEDSTLKPCVTISPGENGKYVFNNNDPATEPKTWNAVNAVCDLLAELAWEQVRSAPETLSLHCAGFEINDRLILIPNTRRAGKSTLSACLAFSGFNIFSDDVIRLKFTEDGQILGVASGVLPRIRLPIPEDFPKEFHNWTHENPGQQNTQYKFLETEHIPARGTELPIGGITVLDRSDGATEPLVEELEPQEALNIIIHQNFAREAHAGRILKALEAIAKTVPLYRVRYASASTAVVKILETLDHTELGTARVETALTDQPASLEPAAPTAKDLFASGYYERAPGLTVSQIAEDLFIADKTGYGIFRLNPGSAMIWQLLEAPISPDEIVETISAAFPDVDAQQIATDTHTTLQQFLTSNLVVPVVPEHRAAS